MGRQETMAKVKPSRLIYASQTKGIRTAESSMFSRVNGLFDCCGKVVLQPPSGIGESAHDCSKRSGAEQLQVGVGLSGG